MFVQHFCCSEDGDVDITGFDDTGASFCINETIYEVKNDSVIMKEDADSMVVLQMSLTMNQVTPVI